MTTPLKPITYNNLDIIKYNILPSMEEGIRERKIGWILNYEKGKLYCWI
jgi:hypothetical protein